MMKEIFKTNRQTNLFFILSGLFIGIALLAELIGVKIFSVEKILGIAPLHLRVPGGPLDLNMSIGVIIWPLIFVITDIINEYFGHTGVRRVSFFTAFIIGLSFFVLYVGTKLPPADFWLKLNGTDSIGRAFDINYAYAAIFRQGMGIIIGSITAFLLSQLIDAYAFQYIRKLTGNSKLWLRATGSTAISQIFDSFVILYIAFGLLGNWSIQQVITVGIVQYIYKVTLAILLTPLLYVFHYFIDKYLNGESNQDTSV